MNADQILSEIREANLSYLMLAQSMVKEDRDTAMFHLGVSEDVANVLEKLSPAQILRMSNNNMLLFRFRFDDSMIVDMLSDYGNGKLMGGTHAAVLMSAQPAAGLTS